MACQEYDCFQRKHWYPRNVPDIPMAKCKCVKTPERANWNDAGIDFFVPNFTEPMIFFPHDRKMIPSGIHVKIPHGYMLKAEDKSGVGTKKGLKYIGGVIDETFQGELKICLFNTSGERVKIYPGEKIIQFILIPVLYSKVELTTLDKLYTEKTKRGTGGFGSSGNGIWDNFKWPEKEKGLSETEFKNEYMGTFDYKKEDI